MSELESANEFLQGEFENVSGKVMSHSDSAETFPPASISTNRPEMAGDQVPSGASNIEVTNPQADSIIYFDKNAMKSQMSLIKRKQSIRASSFLDEPRADGVYDADAEAETNNAYESYGDAEAPSLSDAKFKKRSSDFDPLDMKNKKPNASRRKSTSSYLNEFKVERASKPKMAPAIDENQRPSDNNRAAPARRADKVRNSARSEGAGGGVPRDSDARPSRVPRPPRSEVPSSSRPSALGAGGGGVPKPRPVDRPRPSIPNNSNMEMSRDDSSSSVANERAMQDRADDVIGALRRRKNKKVPLFMRLQAEYQKKATELEQEKINAYNLMQYKKKLANPSARDLAEHMQKYEEVRLQEEAKKAQRAVKRKEEWRRAQVQLDDKIDAALPNIPAPSPLHPSPLKKKYPTSLMKDQFNDGAWADDDISILDDDAGSINSLQAKKRRKQPRARPSAAVDPLPEDTDLLMPSIVSPARISPRGRNNLRKKKANILVDPFSTDVMISSADHSLASRSPRSHVKFGTDVKFDDAAASVRSHMSGASSKKSSGTTMPGVYKGQAWIAQLLETDEGEAELAQMYETGFEMHMVEKGLIDGPEARAPISDDII